MDLQTGHLEDRYHARIILLLLLLLLLLLSSSLLLLLLLVLLLLLFTVKLFCIFFQITFPKKFYFFAFWRKKIRMHLVKGVLS